MYTNRFFLRLSNVLALCKAFTDASRLLIEKRTYVMLFLRTLEKKRLRLQNSYIYRKVYFTRASFRPESAQWINVKFYCVILINVFYSPDDE